MTDPPTGPGQRLRAAVEAARFWGEAPGTPHWTGRQDCWLTLTRLRFLAILLVVLPGLLIVAKPAGAPSFSWEFLGTLLLGGVIASGIGWWLAYMLNVAIDQAPGGARTWLHSLERVQSLARIRADGDSFFRLYQLLVAAAAVGGFGLAIFGVITSVAGMAPQEQLRELWVAQAAVEPYVTGVLSVATLGALTLVNSTGRELAALRAEVDHRHRYPERS